MCLRLPRLASASGGLAGDDALEGGQTKQLKLQLFAHIKLLLGQLSGLLHHVELKNDFLSHELL